MSHGSRDAGVKLPKGYTGSSFFRKVLQSAIDRYPEEFEQLKIPEGKSFKKKYADTVVEFETARVNSPLRSEIAKHIVQFTPSELEYSGNGFDGSFNDYLNQSTAPSPIAIHCFDGKPGLSSRIPFRGQYYSNSNLGALENGCAKRKKITLKAVEALHWMESFTAETGGHLNLTGKKFVVMGASAELALTELLLRAGAKVLWIDIQDPKKILANKDDYAGELHVASEAKNILTSPLKIKKQPSRLLLKKTVSISECLPMLAARVKSGV